MTWKLTEWAKTRLPLMGVPWRDLTDEEFGTACERYPELEERGYFERVDEAAGLAEDTDTTPELRRRRSRT